MTKEEFFEKYKAVPEIEKGNCKGCYFCDSNGICTIDEKLIHKVQFDKNKCDVGCLVLPVIYIKKPTHRRLNAFEEITNRFEEWSGDQSHNGDDMADVAKDVINADNAYLLWRIEDLASLEADEFKQEVLKVISDFKCSTK